MSSYGTMGVDWEERIDYARMRRERLTKVRAAMEKLNIDVLLLARRESGRYITGHRTNWSPVANVSLPSCVLPRDGDPILFADVYAQEAIDKTPWLRPENVRYHVTPSELKAAVGRHSSSVIGVDIWNPQAVELLPQLFPKAKFVDGHRAIQEAQMVKTKDEIECLKIAGDITEAGLEAAWEALRPGARECEVLAAAWGEMTRLGSEYFQCSSILASGPNTCPYRKVASDRIIKRGDLVIIDIGGCFNGYWGDTTRTWICGEAAPSKEQVELHQAAYDSLWAAIELCCPGNTTAQVYAAAEPNIQNERLGHGSSLCPWEPPLFQATSKKNPIILQAGMAFNLEPYTGRPGVGGFRLENQLVVTQGEPDIYSTFPFEGRLLKYTHRLDKTTAARA